MGVMLNKIEINGNPGLIEEKSKKSVCFIIEARDLVNAKEIYTSTKKRKEAI